jgi:peptidoglycan-N-acetylglucosamine deacetylase
MNEINTNRLAVSVDVEDWYHIPSVTGSPFSQYRNVNEFFTKWGGRYDYLTDPTHRVLDLLDELNLKATFFVVADVVDNYPGLVKNIAEHGHEIACHGLHHACALDPASKQPLLTQDEFEKQSLQAKTILEDVAGQQVSGYRAPNAYISGWMLDSLEKIGFKYDSSVAINSLYTKMPSRPENVTTLPYYPKRGSLDRGIGKRILEIPWPYLKIYKWKLPTAGGPFLRFFGSRYILSGLNQSLSKGFSVFYFHPIDIISENFPNKFSKNRPLYWLVKGDIVERRVLHILHTFREKLCTCKDIYEEYESKTMENESI